MAINDPILKNIRNDQWSNTTMALILLFFGIATFFIIALAVPQDIKQTLPAIFFGVAFIGSWVALVGTMALGDRTPFVIAGFGEPIKLFGMTFGTPVRVILGSIIGVFLYIIVAIIVSTVNGPGTSPGNILPIGAIIPVTPIFSYLYTVLFSPVLETIFLVGIIFYSIRSNLIKYTSVGRLLSSIPIIGSLTLTVALALFVALIFTILHTTSYSSNLLPSDPDYTTKLVQNLLTIDIICIFWILGMQLTGTIATPLAMHIIQNWIALSDYLRSTGQVLTLVDFVMYVILPLGLIFGLAQIINVLFRKSRGIAMG